MSVALKPSRPALATMQVALGHGLLDGLEVRPGEIGSGDASFIGTLGTDGEGVDELLEILGQRLRTDAQEGARSTMSAIASSGRSSPFRTRRSDDSSMAQLSNANRSARKRYSVWPSTERTV